MMSSSLKRRCFPRNVHGISRAAAFFRNHDSGTFKISAASAGVYNCGALTPPHQLPNLQGEP
jgi:hypothetical protein